MCLIYREIIIGFSFILSGLKEKQARINIAQNLGKKKSTPDALCSQ
jgi:hypothetical protein